MTLSLIEIIDQIKRWTVDDVRRIWHHKKWSGKDEALFSKGINPIEFEEGKAEELDSFEALRTYFLNMLNDQTNSFNSAIDRSHLRIAKAFLLIDDNERLNDFLSEDWEIETSILNSQVFDVNDYQKAMRDQLDELDIGRSKGDISKAQLCYASELLLDKGADNPKIQKITWKGVKSEWGPKIVVGNIGELTQKYAYIYNRGNSKKDDNNRIEKYNIAAKLGHTSQYTSEYKEADVNPEYQNIMILEIQETEECRTLDVHFTELLKQESLPKSAIDVLFTNLAKVYLRKLDHASYNMNSSNLKSTLPRLITVENRCFESLIAEKHEWKALRAKVKPIQKSDADEYYVIHADEWGGNFLVNSEENDVFIIDFEDALIAKIVDDAPLKIQTVGGDLSSRIFSVKKSTKPIMDDGGLNLLASIGRLLTAIIQYPREDLPSDWIEDIVKIYLEAFNKMLVSKPNGKKWKEHWDDSFKIQILVYAWDWALYWKEKNTEGNPFFENKQFDEFVRVVTELLYPEPNSKKIVDEEGRDPPTPEESVMKYPEDGDSEAKELFQKSMDLANQEKFDEAWNVCLSAHSVIEKTGTKTEKGLLYYWVGRLLIATNPECNEVGLEWFSRSIQCLTDNNREIPYNSLNERQQNLLMENWTYTSWVYRIKKEYDIAETYLKKAFSFYHGGEEEFNISLVEKFPSNDTTENILFQYSKLLREWAWLCFEREDYIESSRVFDMLWHKEMVDGDDDKMDNYRMCAAIAYSYSGNHEIAERLELECLDYREKMLLQISDGDAREVSKALRNLGLNANAAKEFKMGKEYLDRCIKSINETDERWVSSDEKEEWVGFIKENMQDISTNSIPKFIDSQYNLFTEHEYIEPYAGVITDKSFQIHVKNMWRKTNSASKVEYCEEFIYSESENNEEMEFFSLLFIITFGRHKNVQHHYQRLQLLGEELSSKSGDFGYLYSSKLAVFYISSLQQESQSLSSELVNISPEYPNMFLASRMYLVSYEMSIGMYQTALDFIEVVERSLPKNDRNRGKLWLLLNQKGVIYYALDRKNESRIIVQRLKGFFDEMKNMQWNLNHFFCHSYPFMILLAENGEHTTLDMMVSIFNKTDNKDDLEDDNLAMLENLNGLMHGNENPQLAYDFFMRSRDFAIEPTIKATALCNLGKYFLNEKDCINALSNFEQALELESREEEFWDLYHYIAACYKSEKDFENSVEFYNKSASINKKLYLRNGVLEHHFKFLESSFHSAIVRWDNLSELNLHDVHLCFDFLVKEGLRELRTSTTVKTETIDAYKELLQEICTLGKEIEEVHYSNQSSRVDILWRKKKELINVQQSNKVIRAEFKQALEIAELERQSGSWSKSIERLKLVVDASKEANEYLFCADALNDLGTCYFEQERFDKAKEYYEEAMDLYCQIEDKEGEVDSLMNLALIANERKRFLDAEAKFDKCLDIYTALGQEVGVADVHINRADIRIEQEHYPEARENIQIALDILKTLNDKKWYLKWATALNVSADLYRKLDCFDEAINELEQAKSLSEEITDIKGLSDLYNNFGIAHMQYGKLLSLDGAPEAIKQFKKAEKYFRIHLETIAEIEERPNKWFEDNGFYTDSKIWSQFPPNDSPNWK
ncbi:MAG: tetratricopeptide repeat protein [Euryarchaeota archaeon]|nr:tetratricopeptide repeat protein [Euryarchaeota archaeon]